MATEAEQAQVIKRLMLSMGMTPQSQILGVGGSWNMHWLMICSSITCASRNATVTSLQTGQVIQHMLCQKSLCKLVTNVMVISEDEFARQPLAGKRHVD